MNSNFDEGKLKKKLMELINKQENSCDIQIHSTKMLGFYVNDILDFAQINHGKFRKDCRPVNVKLVIEEVINILKNKAEQG